MPCYDHVPLLQFLPDPPPSQITKSKILKTLTATATKCLTKTKDQEKKKKRQNKKKVHKKEGKGMRQG